MTGTIVLPKYDPICVYCGHHPTFHTNDGCQAGDPIRNFGLTGLRKCECPGWKRDEAWPPPLVVQR